jgi:hypothetical protein
MIVHIYIYIYIYIYVYIYIYINRNVYLYIQGHGHINHHPYDALHGRKNWKISLPMINKSPNKLSKNRTNNLEMHKDTNTNVSPDKPAPPPHQKGSVYEEAPLHRSQYESSPKHSSPKDKAS